jgi:putative transcriptional regulator
VIGLTTKGRLLVATPVLSEGIFDRSVVLVLEHDDEGALGVVLNKPSTTEVAGPLPDWARLAASPTVVFVGGPVTPEAAVCLARARGKNGAEGWTPLVGGVGSLDLSADADAVAPDIEELRVFSGYSGWSSGQLESEIEAGAWFVVDPVDDDILSGEPDSLWHRVLRRQRGRLALYAAFPADPTAN